jgi:hypothetical protein
MHQVVKQGLICPHMSEDHLKLVGVPGTGWSTRKTYPVWYENAQVQSEH